MWFTCGLLGKLAHILLDTSWRESQPMGLFKVKYQQQRITPMMTCKRVLTVKLVSHCLLEMRMSLQTVHPWLRYSPQSSGTCCEKCPGYVAWHLGSLLFLMLSAVTVALQQISLLAGPSLHQSATCIWQQLPTCAETTQTHLQFFTSWAIITPRWHLHKVLRSKIIRKC